MNSEPDDLFTREWFTKNLSYQMGNIGSEVGRALKWQLKDNQRMLSALNRALQLLDLTMTDKRWKGGRLREICRSREVVVDYFFGYKEYYGSPENLEKYFYYFAVAERRRVGD